MFVTQKLSKGGLLVDPVILRACAEVLTGLNESVHVIRMAKRLGLEMSPWNALNTMQVQGMDIALVDAETNTVQFVIQDHH
jgi:hypothetical protein